MAASTIRKILRAHRGPRRPSATTPGVPWLRSLAETILAIDFVHVDTVMLKRLYAAAVIEVCSRRAYLLGVTDNVTGAWATQPARELAADLEQACHRFTRPTRDRDVKFTKGTQDERLRRAAHRLHPPRMLRPDPHHQPTHLHRVLTEAVVNLYAGQVDVPGVLGRIGQIRDRHDTTS